MRECRCLPISRSTTPHTPAMTPVPISPQSQHSLHLSCYELLAHCIWYTLLAHAHGITQVIRIRLYTVRFTGSNPSYTSAFYFLLRTTCECAVVFAARKSHRLYNVVRLDGSCTPRSCWQHALVATSWLRFFCHLLFLADSETIVNSYSGITLRAI